MHRIALYLTGLGEDDFAGVASPSIVDQYPHQLTAMRIDLVRIQRHLSESIEYPWRQTRRTLRSRDLEERILEYLEPVWSKVQGDKE